MTSWRKHVEAQLAQLRALATKLRSEVDGIVEGRAAASPQPVPIPESVPATLSGLRSVLLWSGIAIATLTALIGLLLS